MTKHTPGKMVVYSSTYGVGVTPEDETEEDVADCEVCFSRSKEEMLANAERIAHTWNCHDELVGALEAMLTCQVGGVIYTPSDHAVKLARDALAKAKGE